MYIVGLRHACRKFHWFSLDKFQAMCAYSEYDAESDIYADTDKWVVHNSDNHEQIVLKEWHRIVTHWQVQN